MNERIDKERLELVVERKQLQSYEWVCEKPDEQGRYVLSNEHIRTNIWHVHFFPAWDSSPYNFEYRGLHSALDGIKRRFPNFDDHLAEQFPAPIQLTWEDLDNEGIVEVRVLVEGVPYTVHVLLGSLLGERAECIRQRWPGRNFEYITPGQLHEAFQQTGGDDHA